jgi:hypothetical protein
VNLVPVVKKESCSSEGARDSFQNPCQKTDGERSIPGRVPRVQEATGMEKIQSFGQEILDDKVAHNFHLATRFTLSAF